MFPAFSSLRQMAFYVGLLLLLLALPLLLVKSILPPREEIYSSLPWGVGAYPYLEQQLFHEKEDIDIAFMGSSKIWWAIDTPVVQAELSKKLGRQAVVRSLCWHSPGCDAFYFTLKDLLEHRKVHTVVFSDCSDGGGNATHARAPYFFRYSENAADIKDLNRRTKIAFYTSSIMGAPRILLDLLRPNLPVMDTLTIAWPATDPNFFGIPSPMRRLGSLSVPFRMKGVYEPFTPPQRASPDDVVIYSDATKNDFVFGKPVAQTQVDFLRKIGVLAREHHVRLVYLDTPQTTESRSTVISNLAYWPDILQEPVAMMGVPEARLFDGWTQDQIEKLFYNFEHMDASGQQYFTSVLTPALVDLYEKQAYP